MATVMLSGFRCERCSHEWLPRKKNWEPRVCPACKSPYWNVPRKADVEQTAQIAVNKEGGEN